MKISRGTAFAVAALTFTAVVGFDYATYAANGDSLLIGRINNGSKPTTLNNNGKGPVLRLNSSGPAKPPLAVDSSAKVKRFNADKVDGLDANGISRVSSFFDDNTSTANPSIVEAETTLEAPKKGYVIVTGNFSASSSFVTCTTRCYGPADLIHVETGAESPQALVSVQEGITDYTPVSITQVFPVAKGVHTFQLRSADGADRPFVANAGITAFYVPFDGDGDTSTGSTTTLAPRAQLHRAGR